VKEVFCSGVVTQFDGKVKPYPDGFPSKPTDAEAVAAWCSIHKIALVVVGPEQPLVDGMVDVLAEAGIPTFGPRAIPAQLEGSKHFAHEFMSRHGILTSRYQTFTSIDAACKHIDEAPYPALVVKACGLAAGKGVVVAANNEEAKAAVASCLGDLKFGDSGSTVVIEELLVGPEISVFAMCDGETVACFPPCQDHKRLLDGDEGPNTGGMGAFGPVPFASAEALEFTRVHVAQKVVDGMKSEGTPYKGLLYCQMMLTADGPRVVEFNARFGDPETQVVMQLLQSDLYHAMLACADGPRLPPSDAKLELVFEAGKSAATIVLAAPGYPEPYPKGLPITGLGAAAALPNVLVFHAGTRVAADGSGVETSGGRVLNVAASGGTLQAAIASAYSALRLVEFEGAQFRTDIGKQALKESGATAAAAAAAAAVGEAPAGLTYADAGVSIDAGEALVDKIKPVCKMTMRAGCDAAIGGFGGLFDLKAAGYTDPLLVSGTDGVGTKLEIAKAVGDHTTIGIDLVAMCVNDILANGAEPLYFLDYFACGKLDVGQAAQVVEGVGKGCLESGCALAGGETAEMPGMYAAGDYDVAGFAVGAVERGNLLPKIDEIAAGDVIIGLASSGVHSNGYSLVRRVVAMAGLAYSDAAPYAADGKTLGQSLLTPTRLYCKQVLACTKKDLIKAYAHITGGGLVENIPRILPDQVGVELDATKWIMPPVYKWVKAQGRIASHEMTRTFNCGLGAVLIVAPERAAEVLATLKEAGEAATEVGFVVAASETQPRVMVHNADAAFAATADVIVTAPQPKPVKRKTAVLISGSGTNLQSLIDATKSDPDHGAEITFVVSNKAGVQGLDRAAAAGIETAVVDHTAYESREAFQEAVHTLLVGKGVEVVCLAGFMRILTASFVQKWKGKLINVHPSLLPCFPGTHVHKQALSAGVRITGCTVHFVDDGVDTGPIILQGTAPVFSTDTEQSLQERVKLVEHQLFPQALDLVAKGAVVWELDPTPCGRGKVVRTDDA